MRITLKLTLKVSLGRVAAVASGFDDAFDLLDDSAVEGPEDAARSRAYEVAGVMRAETADQFFRSNVPRGRPGLRGEPRQAG